MKTGEESERTSRENKAGKRQTMSGRRGSAGLSNNEMEAVSKFVYDDLLDEVMLGLAFDVHRSVRTGLFSVLESAESPSKVARLEGETSTATKPGTNIPLTDVFGQTISTMVGVPALKKQPECVCPNCQRNLAASRQVFEQNETEKFR